MKRNAALRLCSGPRACRPADGLFTKPSTLTLIVLSNIRPKLLSFFMKGLNMNKLHSFIIFLTVFLTLYGLLHLYFYRKLSMAIDMNNLCNVSVIIALCFLTLSPIFIYKSTNTEHFLLTNMLAHIGFIWMGGLFLFFSINLLVDSYRVIIHISNWIVSPNLSRYLPGDRATFFITLLIITGILIYGRFEAENIAVERIELRTAKLPPQVSSLRIVQITDIHFSMLNGVKLAQKIGRIIEGLHPDILVSTGDLIDRGLEDKEAVVSLFRYIKAPYGKYAVAGNHEFISGINKAVEFTEKAGFTMLRNEGITAGNFLKIAGIDDPAAKRYGIASAVSEDKVLEFFSPDSLNIFLKHQPKIENNGLGKFDLQISGHTHNGQIFPFTLITLLFYPYNKGLFKVSNDSYLYVSRGTGTWGPPIRFLTFPEITVIDFQREGLETN
jgi:predicted MPP superfamily phosphohydrolase